MNNKSTTTTTTTNITMEEAHRRTWYMRVGFVLSLLAATIVCGVVSYVVVDDLERSVGVQTYESIAKNALEGAQGITLRKLQGSEVVASMLSFAYPNADQWPFIDLDGYVETASKVAKLSSSTSVATIVLVEPNQTEAFEQHAATVFDNRIPGAGTSDFGFGVWKKDTDKSNPTYPDKRLHDTTGETDYESKYNLLAPIFQHNRYNASSLMYNVHSNVFRGKAIDSMLDCVDQNQDVPNPSCSVITDFIELIVKPGEPAALIYGPIYAANEPNRIVGMTGTSIHWKEVLTNVVPDYVDGLDCVVSSGTGTYTYSINQGQPELKGGGDLHDTDYDDYMHSIVLNDIETGAISSKNYTLKVYPTNLMLDEFRTNSPTAIALGFAGVILFCAVVFFSYDSFVRGENRQNKAILEMKRRFVRFVSHEIRTPLNTVCMGLELLRAELGSQMIATRKSGKAGEQQVMTLPKEKDNNAQQQDPFTYLMDLTTDILENSESAVTILTDLLNYDKIETGTFQLEIGVVPIWDLVRKTVSSFDIQARKRNVTLNYQPPASNGSGDLEQAMAPDYSMLNVMGDDMRLRQVILNLVSNALKFVEESEGVIDVAASYHPEGFPDSRPLYTSINTGGGQDPEPISFPRAGSVRISISDNGEGMTAEQLKLLFQEGVQFDANKLQAGGGSGLGLYITKGLVEQHGGTITVQSEGRKCGTTFTIELPIYSCKLPTDPDHTSTSSDTHSTDNPGAKCVATSDQHRRILVVDDAAMNRKMLMRLLEWAGHTCDSATNGQEAVDAVLADQEQAKIDENHIPFDTILMDFEMPVMDGPEATSLIRGNGCKAFIVGVTGNVLLEDVNYFKSKGADMVLAKPLKITALDDAWRKCNR